MNVIRYDWDCADFLALDAQSMMGLVALRGCWHARAKLRARWERRNRETAQVLR